MQEHNELKSKELELLKINYDRINRPIKIQNNNNLNMENIQYNNNMESYQNNNNYQNTYYFNYGNNNYEDENNYNEDYKYEE